MLQLTPTRRIALYGAVIVLLSSLASPALAGGLFLPVHGVRGLGRAGAFVAGADDAGGIWYNPATMDRVASPEVLLDGSMVLFGMQYTRVDSGGNVLPMVENDNVPLPVPTLAVAWPIGRSLWVGGSFSAGYGVLPSYPAPSYGICDPQAVRRCIDTAHRDAPQRYSVISYNGTFFLRLDLAIAWRIRDWVTVGLALQNTFGRLSQTKAVTSYNGTLSSGPEDPDFDTLTDVRMTALFNPSAQLGATLRPHRDVTVGLAFQLPMRVKSAAQLAVQLPVSPLYAASSVAGRSAEVTIDFPMAVAGGVEWRPSFLPGARLEVDVGFENWAAADKIRFTPKDIRILELPGVGTYEVPEIVEEMGYTNTVSFRLGAEYTLPQLGRALTLRAGYGFETGATPLEKTSLVSTDFKKHLLTFGASYSYWRLRFDFGFGVVLTPQRFISHLTSEAPQVNPIKPNETTTIGGGTYTIKTVIVGIGVNARL